MLQCEGPHSIFYGIHGYLFVVGGEGIFYYILLMHLCTFEIIWVYVKKLDGPLY
jgi:hypothetical protein